MQFLISHICHAVCVLACLTWVAQRDMRCSHVSLRWELHRSVLPSPRDTGSGDQQISSAPVAEEVNNDAVPIDDNKNDALCGRPTGRQWR
jgi:hypothetical protein